MCGVDRRCGCVLGLQLLRSDQRACLGILKPGGCVSWGLPHVLPFHGRKRNVLGLEQQWSDQPACLSVLQPGGRVNWVRVHVLFVHIRCGDLQGSKRLWSKHRACLRVSNQAALSPAFYHTCSLSMAGAVSCWGSNDFGQIIVPAFASSNQVALATGGSHSCSLSMAGYLICWGRNDFGQINVPASASSNQVAVSAGGQHTCSLSMAGVVLCWGDNSNGQINVPASASSNQVAVSAGRYYSCSLSMTGAVSCWGDNDHGQATVPAIFTYFGAALPCRAASFSISSPTPTAIPTPGFACAASLYRTLPRMDLVGTLVGSSTTNPSRLASEESCRISCCSAPSCQGYSFALYDGVLLTLNAPVACFLYSNVTQLIPSSGYASGVLLSSL